MVARRVMEEKENNASMQVLNVRTLKQSNSPALVKSCDNCNTSEQGSHLNVMGEIFVYLRRSLEVKRTKIFQLQYPLIYPTWATRGDLS